MNTLVQYPPENVGEYSEISYSVWGIIPIRIVVTKRVEGWTAYFLLKYMPSEYYLAYGDKIDEPTTFERVRLNGDKLPEKYARELFPEMEGSYIV